MLVRNGFVELNAKLMFRRSKVPKPTSTCVGVAITISYSDLKTGRNGWLGSGCQIITLRPWKNFDRRSEFATYVVVERSDFANN